MSGAIYQRFPMLGRARGQVWRYSPEYRRPRHFHDEPELNLVVAGRATFGVGAGFVEVQAGDLLGFPPGQDHVLVRGSADLALFAIGMTNGFSREVMRGDGFRVGLPLHLRLSRTMFVDLVARAASVVEHEGVEQRVAELWEAAYGSRTLAARSPATCLHVLTRRSLATIAEAPELGRAELARLTGACPTELSRNFRRDMGMTLVQYRTRVRLLRFIQFVDGQACNFAAAALRAGFGSYSQCHRMFQAAFGCTPSRFFLTGFRAQMENSFEPLPG